MKAKKLRKELEKNKIFFEVFSYLFLGIASLVVAYFSYQTSKGELEILRLEHLPVINLDRKMNENFDKIEIKNAGYHLFNPKVDYTTVFIIKGYKNDLDTEKRNYFFEIKDYFVVDFETNNSTGLISTIASSEYYDRQTKRLKYDCYSNFGDKYNVLSFEHFIRFTYDDENDNKHLVYYKIDPFSMVEISKITYNKYLDSIQNTDKNDLRYLTDMKSDVLFDYIEQIQ
ncbi:MAG TPA: hypothetical protein DEA82_13245 [Flavobacteriaceae bacterium]|nr:hypothetical protein [Flavobacteriaceae bacterium]HBR55086.1 hypothetical protein [Flavobacteriaceae bacterium]